MAHQTVGHAPPRRTHGPLADCPQESLVPPGPEPDCPVDITLEAIRGRWTPLVLRELLRRRQASWSELSAALPDLSDKVLADRLTQLTRSGVVERRRTSGWPPRVSYELTAAGRELEPVILSLWAWGAARREDH